MNNTMKQLAEGVEKLTRRNTKTNKSTGCHCHATPKTPNNLNRGTETPVLWIPPTTSRFSSALKMLNIDDVRDLSGLCINTESNIVSKIDGLGKAIVVYIADNGGDSKFTHFRWVIGDDPNHPKSINHAQIAMCDINNQPIAIYKWQAEGNPKTVSDYKREYENMTKMFACFIISATEEFIKKASAATPHIKPEPKPEEVKIDTIVDPPADKISGYDTEEEAPSSSIITTSVEEVIDIDVDDLKEAEVDDLKEAEEDNDNKEVYNPTISKDDNLPIIEGELGKLLDMHEKIYPSQCFKGWIRLQTLAQKKDFSKDKEFMSKLRNVVENPIPFKMGQEYVRAVRCW